MINESKVRQINPAFPPKPRMPYVGDHSQYPRIVNPEPISERGKRRRAKRERGEK